MMALSKARIADAINSDAILFPFLTFFFGTIAILKGIRFPSLWAATQAQIDYRNGFVKRGLFGATLTEPLHLSSYMRFAACSYVLFAIAVMLFALFVRQSGIVSRVSSGIPVLLFVSSLASTFFAHMVGYLDIPQVILLLLVVLIRSSLLRFACALPVCVLSLMLHESFLLLYLPVLLFSFVVDALAGRVKVWQASGSVAVLATLSLGVCILLAAKAPMAPATAQHLETSIQQSVDFPLRQDFFVVLQRSAIQNIREELVLYRTGQEFAPVLSCLIALGPVIVFQAWFVQKVSRLGMDERRARIMTASAAVVLFVALSMQLLGWDIGRWYSVATLDLFLVLALLVRSLPTLTLGTTPTVARFALLIVAINMASGETLFDEQVPKPYPFVKPAQRTVREWFHHAPDLRPKL